jgi:hypothetical protein
LDRSEPPGVVVAALRRGGRAPRSNLLGHIWAASAKNHESPESESPAKSQFARNAIPANSARGRDGKEGVDGSSPAEGSCPPLRHQRGAMNSSPWRCRRRTAVRVGEAGGLGPRLDAGPRSQAAFPCGPGRRATIEGSIHLAPRWTVLTALVSCPLDLTRSLSTQPRFSLPTSKTRESDSGSEYWLRSRPRHPAAPWRGPRRHAHPGRFSRAASGHP